MPDSMHAKKAFWSGKRVLITGHTGFKGSWLSLLLTRFGSKVYGFALPPPSKPALFTDAKVHDITGAETFDILDKAALDKAFAAASPEIVFHLAAQPIVRKSYTDPVYTFNVNALGTVNLLEACRHCSDVKAIVVVTTDKCYENPRENRKAFKEDCKLGGHDPYSASKACAEIVASSYRESFFSSENAPGLATARAGNVIGGGDWAEDRLLPDFFRAAGSGKSFNIRNPSHVRPWQHVLDALNGYLTLAQKLHANPKDYSEAWNFGPEGHEFKSVAEVVKDLAAKWPGKVDCVFENLDGGKMPEAPFLSLDTTKARSRLSWGSTWDTARAIEMTSRWYEKYFKGEAAEAICLAQIEQFFADGEAQ